MIELDIKSFPKESIPTELEGFFTALNNSVSKDAFLDACSIDQNDELVDFGVVDANGLHHITGYLDNLSEAEVGDVTLTFYPWAEVTAITLTEDEVKFSIRGETGVGPYFDCFASHVSTVAEAQAFYAAAVFFSRQTSK